MFEFNLSGLSGFQSWASIAGVILVSGLAMTVFLKWRQLAKRTREAQRAGDAKFVTAFRQAPFSLSISRQVDGVILETNETFLTYLRADRDDVLGTRITDWVKWRRRELLKQFMNEVASSGESRQLDAEIEFSDGRVGHFFVSGRTIEIENEACTLTVAYDISDYKRAMTAVRRSERQLRQVIDLVPHKIFAHDSGGRFLMANQALADTYGIPVEQIVGSLVTEIHPNFEEAKRFLAEDSSVLAGGKRVVIPEQIVHDARGESHTELTTKVPYEVPGTGAPAVLGVSVDITEQISAAQALRRSAASFAEIVELAPDAVISIDADFRIVLFNRGAETIFGHAAAEVAGQPIHMLLPEQFRANHGTQIDGFGLAAENSRKMNKRGKVVGLRKDGTEFDAEASIGKLQRGGEAAFIVLLRDVSERVMWEEQLRHAQKMEAVGQLTGGVAHDFNNLLTIILGNLQLLQRRVDDGPSTERLFDMAISAAQRGGDLTHRLLAFSRRSPLAPKPTNLADLAEGIVELTMRTICKNISVEVSSEDDPWLVDIDPAQLQAALMNLAINAAHAMPSGGELKFETSNVVIDPAGAPVTGLPVPGEYVRISVTDNGTGMAPEIVERAFDPFFTTKDVGEGSGLGLSMVYGFVRQSGGHAWISSKSGIGTTVTLHFPRADAKDSIESDDVGGPAINSDGTETVLVVEDNDDVRQIAINHLVSRGYQVVAARHGPDALQKLQDHGDIDVLFTDVMLPEGVSGTELAGAALRLRPGLKLLFTSGNARVDVARDFNGGGDFLFLPKPYLGEDLAVAVRGLIKKGENQHGIEARTGGR